MLGRNGIVEREVWKILTPEGKRGAMEMKLKHQRDWQNYCKKEYSQSGVKVNQVVPTLKFLLSPSQRKFAGLGTVFYMKWPNFRRKYLRHPYWLSLPCLVYSVLPYVGLKISFSCVWSMKYGRQAHSQQLPGAIKSKYFRGKFVVTVIIK